MDEAICARGGRRAGSAAVTRGVVYAVRRGIGTRNGRRDRVIDTRRGGRRRAGKRHSAMRRRGIVYARRELLAWLHHAERSMIVQRLGYVRFEVTCWYTIKK